MKNGTYLVAMMKYFVAVPYLLQCCGLFPFSSQVVFNDLSKVRSGRFLFAWTVLGVLIVLAECIVGFSTEIFSSLDGIQSSIEIIKFITNSGSHLLSVIEVWMTRARQESIWKINGRAEKLLKKSDESMQAICYKKIFRTFGIYLLITLTIEIYYFASTIDGTKTTTVWYVNIVSAMVCRIRYLQHIMYTTLLTFWFSNIKNELKELAKECKIKPSRILLNEGSGDGIDDDRRILKRIDVLKEVYNMLFEVSGDLNSCFGIAQLANLLDNFVQLTCDFYWIYILLASNQLYNLVELVLLVLPTIIILILMLSSCERCLEEIRYIAFYIHEFERDSTKYDFDLIVENFALQVLTEHFEFSVAGFFSMSFNLLQEIFGAITTYMVILIQFTPSTGKAQAPGVKVDDFENTSL